MSLLAVAVHCKRNKHDVYIGRPGPWGNPFRAGCDGTREQVIERYKEVKLKDLAFLLRARIELKGKKLGCWCTPLACHGDFLAAIANGEYDEHIERMQDDPTS